MNIYMKRTLWIYLMLCLICSVSVAEEGMNSALTIETWEIDRHGAIYAYIPENLPTDTKVPMVLAMNCTTGNPQAEVETNGWDRVCAEEGFIVVAPTYNNYATYSEVPYMEAVLDEAIARYPIDPERVYATGFSNGGALSVALASECPERIAAISAAGWMVGARNTEHGLLMPFQVLQGTEEYTQRNGAGDMEIMDDEKVAIADLFRMNRMDVSEPDYHAVPYWGYRPDAQRSIYPEYCDYDPRGGSPVFKSGVEWQISDYFKEGYDAPFAQLILIEDAPHIPHDHHARIAWEFFSHFRRTGSGVITEQTPN